MSKAQAVLKKVKDYLECHRFINALVWKDIYRSIIVAVGMSGIAVVTQTAAFASAITYANWLKIGEIKHVDLKFIEPFSVDPRQSLLLLFGLGILVSLCWLFNGWMQYKAEKRFLAIQRKVEEILTNIPFRMLQKRISNSKDLMESKVPISADYFLKTRFRDPKIVAVSFKQATSCIIPALTFTISSIALIHLNPLFSLSVFIIILITSIPLMAINIKGARAMMGVEDSATPARLAMQFEASAFSEFYLKELKHTELQKPIDIYRDHYFERTISLERASFVSSMTSGIVFLFIIISLGAMIIRSGTSWGELGVFLAAVHFCLNNFRTLVRKVAAINRFFQYLKRYKGFIEDLKGVESFESKSAPLESLVKTENTIIISNSAETFFTFKRPLVKKIEQLLSKSRTVEKAFYPFRKAIMNLEGQKEFTFEEFWNSEKLRLEKSRPSHLLFSTGFIPNNISSTIKSLNDLGISMILICRPFVKIDESLSLFKQKYKLSANWEITPLSLENLTELKSLAADQSESDLADVDMVD